MRHAQLTLLVATLRLGGTRSVLLADLLIDTASKLRPAVFAQALAAGRSTDMAKLISAGNLGQRIAEMAKERN